MAFRMKPTREAIRRQGLSWNALGTDERRRTAFLRSIGLRDEQTTLCGHSLYDTCTECEGDVEFFGPRPPFRFNFPFPPGAWLGRLILSFSRTLRWFLRKSDC